MNNFSTPLFSLLGQADYFVSKMKIALKKFHSNHRAHVAKMPTTQPGQYVWSFYGTDPTVALYGGESTGVRKRHDQPRQPLNDALLKIERKETRASWYGKACLKETQKFGVVSNLVQVSRILGPWTKMVLLHGEQMLYIALNTFSYTMKSVHLSANEIDFVRQVRQDAHTPDMNFTGFNTTIPVAQQSLRRLLRWRKAEKDILKAVYAQYKDPNDDIQNVIDFLKEILQQLASLQSTELLLRMRTTCAVSCLARNDSASRTTIRTKLYAES